MSRRSGPRDTAARKCGTPSVLCIYSNNNNGNGGLMSETKEVPWDIQMNRRSSGLHKRLQSQDSPILGGKMLAPAPAPNSVQYAMGCKASNWAWTPGPGAGQGSGFRRCKVQPMQPGQQLVTSGLQYGSSMDDAAYMQGVTGSGQVGSYFKRNAWLRCSRLSLDAWLRSAAGSLAR